MPNGININQFSRELTKSLMDARKKALKKLAEYSLSDISTIFKTEGRSHDVEWAALTQKYLNWKLKQGYSEKILAKTTSLNQSFGYKITNGGLSVQIGTTVPYAIYQEYGTKRGIPSRPFIYPVGSGIIKAGIPFKTWMEAMQG
jgi:phage gpG-like protein